ncbi:MAG: hypothetical protein WCK47_00430 [bacterium]|nr:hypothetical protein [Candidatus Sumerlaeota bacterium]
MNKSAFGIFQTRLRTIVFAMAIMLSYYARAYAYYQPAEATSGALVKGIVQWEGVQPDIIEFQVNVDEVFCAPSGKKYADLLMVNPNNRGVKDAIVYLVNIREGKSIDEFAKAAMEPIMLTGCDIKPSQKLFFAGGRLGFITTDRAMHSVRVQGPGYFDETIQMPMRNIRQYVRLNHTGNYSIRCNRHPWENANVMVVEHPYYTFTDESGGFEFRNVPERAYYIVAWHRGIRVTPRIRLGLAYAYDFSEPFSVQQRVRAYGRLAENIRLVLSEPRMTITDQKVGEPKKTQDKNKKK